MPSLIFIVKTLTTVICEINCCEFGNINQMANRRDEIVQETVKNSSVI